MTAPALTPEVIAAALGRFPPTAEQSRIIAAPSAPALVVAGAGSGKTETMAARVVWLVANGLVRREEVLGLTFTRKAAGELAERVRRRLARLGEFRRLGLLPHLPALHRAGLLDGFLACDGDDRARRALQSRLVARVAAAAPPPEADTLLHRPTVATYNSFADGIVREHGLRIGRDPDATVMTESAAWLLMRRVVYAADDPRLVRLGRSAPAIVDAALGLARDAVDNIVDLDRLAAFPARFRTVRDLPSTRRGVDVYRDVADAVADVDALEALVDLARDYDARKRRLGLLDFADQVAGALQIVQASDAVADTIRQRYRVVLLDEYQDTSVVQTRLLAAVFAGRAVMAVGDPHQAIYGWRGASAGNLGGFGAAFADGGGCRTYPLRTSWRNSRSVLRAAAAVLAPLADTTPVPMGALRARPDAPEGDVRVHVAPDLDAEADAVAAWFDTVRTERAARGRPTTAAALFRTKKHMLRFADALADRGVPHRILGLGGLLSTPEVVDVVSALRVVSDPTAGSALIRLLAGPRWAIGLADLRELADLARRVARQGSAAPAPHDDAPAAAQRVAADPPASLAEALDVFLRLPDGHPRLSGFTVAARHRLREAAAVFAGLRRAAGDIVELIPLIERELRLDVELAANEARGPARTSSARLRAFTAEVHAFLSTDERGTLPALLAWLDHAEQADELTPHTDPPEDDVVQLLTIHAAKGLEWDAVAVVRMVDGELPTRPRDTKGWLRFGVLPYPFRPDAAWLPELGWRAARTQQDLHAAIETFTAAHRARQLEEERRLAYVAVTRARDRLLLSAAPWAGTTRPRPVSPFLADIAAALGVTPAEPDTADDPYRGRGRILQWPMDPLGTRRAAVVPAAAAVRRAQQDRPAAADDDLALLLAERERRHRPAADAAPVRIPASRYKDFVADYAGTVAAIRRPLPERPFPQTRLGTRFHAWVQQRSGLPGSAGSLDDALWEQDDDEQGDDTALRTLQDAFLRSEWAQRRPIAVETEIDFPFTELDGTVHLAICKLDAVYRNGDRIEIVDWKTGAPPRDDAQRRSRMLQLELYRRAYHEKHGVPLQDIDVALFYVAHGLVLRG